MGRGIYWNTKPEDTVKAAKARAKAALNEKNPRLTALEAAFYNAFKKQQSQSQQS
jgi:hypothetical protein